MRFQVLTGRAMEARLKAEDTGASAVKFPDMLISDATSKGALLQGGDDDAPLPTLLPTPWVATAVQTAFVALLVAAASGLAWLAGFVVLLFGATGLAALLLAGVTGSGPLTMAQSMAWISSSVGGTSGGASCSAAASDTTTSSGAGIQRRGEGALIPFPRRRPSAR